MSQILNLCSVTTVGTQSAVTFSQTYMTAISVSRVGGTQADNYCNFELYGVLPNGNSQLIQTFETNGFEAFVQDLGTAASAFTQLYVVVRNLSGGTLYVTAERSSRVNSTFWYAQPRYFCGPWGSVAASESEGMTARFISGTSVFTAVSDGTRWRPVGALAVLQPNASVTGTTNETTLSSVTIPAGLMGVDGSVRVTAIFTFVGTAGIKTMRAKFGGTTFVNSGPANTTLSASIFRTISNLTASSQVAIPVTAAEGGAQATTTVVGSVDTSVDQAVAITVQLASAADSATLNKLIVEVI